VRPWAAAHLVPLLHALSGASPDCCWLSTPWAAFRISPCCFRWQGLVRRGWLAWALGHPARPLNARSSLLLTPELLEETASEPTAQSGFAAARIAAAGLIGHSQLRRTSTPIRSLSPTAPVRRTSRWAGRWLGPRQPRNVLLSMRPWPLLLVFRLPLIRALGHKPGAQAESCWPGRATNLLILSL